MSLYSMLFGQNAQADLLLAVVGLRRSDVERLRDVFVDDDRIAVYTRTGGGNRESYPQLALYRNPLFVETEDDDFDSTYATFYFRIPDGFVQDVEELSDPLSHGIRREFAQHIARTLRREPTEGDREMAAVEAERVALKRTNHFLANGHTLVPLDDSAMKAALEIAEKNGGGLRTGWGILPLRITVHQNFHPWPSARAEDDRLKLVRAQVGCEWMIDEGYWQHCQDRFADAFPISMAKIARSVDMRLARERERAKR